eukprot:IDg18709t1
MLCCAVLEKNTSVFECVDTRAASRRAWCDGAKRVEWSLNVYGGDCMICGAREIDHKGH